MAGILIFSEKTNLTLELATAAGQLGTDRLLALTINNEQQAEELSAQGIEVGSINDPDLLTADIAATASALQQVATKLDLHTVLLSSDRRGKELAGRVAEAMNAGCLTDVKGFCQKNNQVACIRNTLGGATVATEIITTPQRVIAVSPRAFAPAARTGIGSIQTMLVNVPVPTIKLLETRSKAGAAVDLQAAERLVIVGQGVEDQADLAWVDKVAKALGAETGCSKPVATDKKWFSEDQIIGLSGKICKPALALILGVSGQVQFTVGVREAQIIVSINKDENAFMNKISDYVLVADLKDALPELATALE